MQHGDGARSLLAKNFGVVVLICYHESGWYVSVAESLSNFPRHSFLTSFLLVPYNYLSPLNATNIDRTGERSIH
jgi:hypothetical protein